MVKWIRLTRVPYPASWVIVAVFLIAVAALTKTEPKSWNDQSHIAAIESFVERGTWAIDGSAWVGQTGDKVFLQGRFYSDKMPLLSLVGAGVYAILHYGFGGSLASNCHLAGKFCAYYWLTLGLVGLPAALMLWLFYDFARRRAAPQWAALIGTFAFGLGTMVFPYALVFNHHLPAAVSLFASFYLLTAHAASSRWGMLAAGFLATLALSFDALAGVMAVSLFAIALACDRSQARYLIVGAAIPLALTALLDYQITQTVFPPYLIPNGFAYPGSALPATIGGNAAPDDYAVYVFPMFVGGKGLFPYNPLLLFALAGAIGVVRHRKHALRVEAVCVLFGFILQSLHLATNTRDLGGTGYGERWFVSALPLLFPFIFFAPPLNLAIGKSAAWILFIPLLGLSVFSSLQGAQAPWHEWLPPAQMIRFREAPNIIGIRWNVKFP